MFSSIKIEEFMESKHSAVFRVELVTKNAVLESWGTHFMHMRVNRQIFFLITITFIMNLVQVKFL